MMKKRNRSRPTTARKMSNRATEKFTIKTGIIAGRGTISEAR
jgi:hypothetical protein